MVTAPLRVALLGYGLAGSVFHAPLIAAVPGLRLAAVVTRDPERSAQARADLPGVEVLASADDVWARAADLDVAVVATTNRTHVPLALAAVDAGLAVVVDKPLATSAAEARRLVEAARSAGVVLTTYQNRRWDGDLLTLRRLVGSGALGQVRRFESRFERWRPTPKPGWRETGTLDDAGGVLNDLGSHVVDQALLLFGPVERVHGEVLRRRAGVDVDDDAFVALTHTSGTVSHLWMSAVAADLGPRFRVLGSEAAYVKHGFDVQEAALRTGARPDDPGFGDEPETAWGRVGSPGDERPAPTERGDYRAFYVALERAVRGEGPVPVDPDDSVRGLDVLEAARRSAAEGVVVPLG
ncbi:MAG: Gfo/Idh/MocA family oxidoreductase [Actinomycetota bacterium]|nr:Gfo/Idh/MocA family oxidoreductase [Actinomycetota bacterium]